MDTETLPHEPCANCSTAIVPGQNYCPNCGQKTPTPRLSLHEIGAEFVHALAHVDRSALSLIWQLLVRPGAVARDYVSGKRKRYFGPFAFLVVSVAFTSAVIAISGFEAVTTDAPNGLAAFLQHHINLLFFVEIPLLAAACRLIGFREPFNYAEYLVLTSYIGGLHILFYAVVVIPVWFILRSDTALLARLFYVTLAIGPLYLAYGMYQFLPGRRFSSAIKGLFASLLTQVATQVAISIIEYFFL
jgi:Protein of unknown function (DUF3667)